MRRIDAPPWPPSRVSGWRPVSPPCRRASVRGRGLLLAAELEAVRPAGRRGLLDHGLVINAVTPTALRLAPPITVSDAEIDEALAIIDEVLG